MRVYHFSEHPYPNAWDDPHGYLRVNLPNRALDPKIAADLFHRYWDEYLLADELGLDLMLNEHHQTATCMNATSIVSLAVLARQTRQARLLILGYPIGHRPDPLRAAEELSTIDVVSRGRLAAAVAAAASSGLEHDRIEVERAHARRARLCDRGARLGLQHPHALRFLS
jgi:alkanesulfonate monooxygenase SsuD/methylene tetrahydromethanopterin reductase-like flavin-dependent oxidoreductase (luciferase family)